MKYLKPINEYRNQLEIPFDNKHPLYDKPTHIHVLDYLLSISTKIMDIDDFYTSYNKMDIMRMWDENFDAAYNSFFDFDIDHSESLKYERFLLFLESYPLNDSDNHEYYNQETIEKFNELMESGKDIYYINRYMDFDYEDGEEYLSDKGKQVYKSKDFNKSIFENQFDEYGAYDKILDNLTDNGVIKIWRSISFGKGDKVDVYTNASNYKGVGVYWSWDEDKAEAYWGERDGDEYILHGLVRPDDINWQNTIYKSAYHLKNECEIELEESGAVLIYRVTHKQTDKSLPLKKPILVKI